MNLNAKLVRSRNDCYIAGVCGGIAKTYNIDPTLVRAVFAIATVLGFSGVLIYLLLWWLMPEEDTA